MDIETKRIEWLDIAKGLGIMIVIFGHTISLRYSSIVYTFHMPLFFLISGLLVHPSQSFKQHLAKGLKRILRPWGIVALISLCVVLLIPEWRAALSLRAIIRELYTADTHTVQNSSIWYLACYFIVFIAFYPIASRVKKPRSTITFALLCTLCLAILYLKSAMVRLPAGRLPFKIDTALVAIVFFMTGYWFRNEIVSNIKAISLWKIALIVTLWAGLAYFNGWTNLASYDFGRLKILFYPIAFIGITMVFFISYRIAGGNNRLRTLLLFYGQNSLIIFAFQSLFIRLYLYTANKIFGLDMVLYADNPVIHQVGSFLLTTFVLSPLLVIAIKWLRSKGVNIL